MTKISSDREYVKNTIENIKKNLIPFDQKFNFNQDFETTLLGNTKSHQLNNDFNSSIKQFIHCLERDLHTINNISQNFEIMDQNISNNINK